MCARSARASAASTAHARACFSRARRARRRSPRQFASSRCGVTVAHPDVASISPSPYAKPARSCARARISRVFTVPCGTPSRRAASFVVNPSIAVASNTACRSGSRRANAGPTEPNAPDPKSSSSKDTACGDRRVHQLGCDRGRSPSAQLIDQFANGDPPQPRADIAAAGVRASRPATRRGTCPAPPCRRARCPRSDAATAR